MGRSPCLFSYSIFSRLWSHLPGFCYLQHLAALRHESLVYAHVIPGTVIIEGYSSSEFHSLYSTRDFLCDLIANRRLTRKTTTPAGIVKNMKKTAAPPPVDSSLTYSIGQNATHAEITEIVTMLRTMLGRSTELPTRGGEYALSRNNPPYPCDCIWSEGTPHPIGKKGI